MKNRRTALIGLLLVCGLAASASGSAQTTRPAKTAKSAPAAPAPPPRIQLAVDSMLDRRTTGDFPPSGLTVTLSLAGEDAVAVRSARPRVTRAADDTGRNLAEAGGSMSGVSADWQRARDDGPPMPRFELASPSRKAKTLTSVEGTLETYLPSRDPAATIRIERVTGRRDKPIALPALASQRIRLQILSKAGLEREKKLAEAKKEAKAAKKRKSGKAEGLDGLAEAMVDSLASTLGSLFSNAGENDLILKVDDPGKKVFSFDLAAADGTPISSYGTTDYEGYRIVRMLEPIPASASLLVRLKTARSFSEIPFSFSNVKLP